MSEIGERILTPLISIPISFVGISCCEGTNKFWESGIFFKTLSASRTLLSCLCKTNLWISVVDVVGPTWTVLAVPICAVELYNLIWDTFWFAPGITGST